MKRNEWFIKLLFVFLCQLIKRMDFYEKIIFVDVVGFDMHYIY
jgi:hypothetical protein